MRSLRCDGVWSLRAFGQEVPDFKHVPKVKTEHRDMVLITRASWSLVWFGFRLLVHCVLKRLTCTNGAEMQVNESPYFWRFSGFGWSEHPAEPHRGGPPPALPSLRAVQVPAPEPEPDLIRTGSHC